MYFWMVLAFYLFVATLHSRGGWREGALLAGMCTATYLSLWSYESSLPLVAIFLGQLGEGVTATAILAMAATAWILTAVLAFAGVRVFDRERILTRWTQ